MSNPSHPPASASTDGPIAPRSGNWQVLLDLWPFVAPYRFTLAATGLFMALAAAGTLLGPLALGVLVDKGLVSPDPGRQLVELRQHFLVLLAVGVAVGVFSAARYYSIAWLGERVTTDLRARVYANVLRQNPVFFESFKVGDVLSRLNSDAALVQTVVGSSLSIGLRNAITALGALIALIWTNPLIMAEVMGLVFFIMLPAMAVDRYVLRLARANRQRVADASAIAVEVLHAVPVVQSFTQEAREAERFAQAGEVAFRAARRYLRTRAPLMAFSISAIVGSMLWGLYQGTQQVLHGEMTPGQLSQTVVYVIMLITSMAVLIEVWGEIQRATSATQRLVELLRMRPLIGSPAQPRPLPALAQGASACFDGVTFAYPARPDRPALESFSLDIAPGQTVALVGPSGAGKTTLFQLLLRFFDAQHGRVLINGVSTRELDVHALRACIGVVPQESTIFSGTLADNIRYGRPQASDDEVLTAAKAAHVHEFVSQWPQRYATQVGERGARLSGGQRQRVAIARAMLKNAPLLLLDEATSALDTHSERIVQAALEAAMQGRTTLVIAHRLSTVIGADRIVVMDHGRIVDAGTHAELLARCQLYARLAAAQFGDQSAAQSADRQHASARAAQERPSFPQA